MNSGLESIVKLKFGLLGAVFFLGCASLKTKDEFDLVTRTQVIMGTLIRVSLPRESRAFAESAFAVFRDVDERLSTYRADSEISQLNAHGSGELSSASLETLQTALSVADETNGAFDPSIGALTLSAYGFGREHEQIPSPKALKLELQRVGYKKIKLSGFRVELPKGVKIDLGGIGKGDAVDRAVLALKSANLSAGVIAASGDIRCFHPCAMGIQHPLKEETEILTFRFRNANMAISTSGVSERKIPGSIENHLIRPLDGRSEKTFYSVSLMQVGDNTRLDAWTTAVAVMDEANALQFLRQHEEVGFVLITARGELLYNAKFINMVQDLSWSQAKDFRIRQVTSQ